jgi:hypothetical protein
VASLLTAVAVRGAGRLSPRRWRSGGVPLVSGTLTLAAFTLWVFLAAHPLGIGVSIDAFLAALPT